MNYNGILNKVVVYIKDSRVIVGTGYRIIYAKPDGSLREGHMLCTLDGKNLPEGWHDMHLCDETQLCVVNRTIQ